jgi:hypothetical protein
VFAVLLAEEEAVGGAVAAAVAGGDGELSGLDEIAEELLDAAAAEVGSALEGGLVGDPLASRVGVARDDEEEDEVRAPFAGAIENGVEVLSGHRQRLLGGWWPPSSVRGLWSTGGGRAGGRTAAGKDGR